VDNEVFRQVAVVTDKASTGSGVRSALVSGTAMRLDEQNMGAGFRDTIPTRYQFISVIGEACDGFLAMPLTPSLTKESLSWNLTE
jgi:hypothetical protein